MFTWSYNGNTTAVLEFDSFPEHTGNVLLDCTDDFSTTPQHADIPEGAEGHFQILRIALKFGNGPDFNCVLMDDAGLVLTQQTFTYGLAYGPAITVVPYGLELGDANDLTPDGYMDANTVQRWNTVGYYDGIYGRARQTALGTNQVWYDSGYNTGAPLKSLLNPYISDQN